jgi:hypothetical protein
MLIPALSFGVSPQLVLLLACYFAQAAGLSQFLRSLLMCSVTFVPTVTPHLSPLSYLSLLQAKSLPFSGIEPVEMHTLDFISFFVFQKPAPSPCAYCIGRPRLLPKVSSLFGLSPSLNSRRLAHFSRFISLHFISLVPFASQTPVAPP